ncbi:MAG: hypothetical protein LBJ63_10670 [Prevotellaceae bacterium]|nr:hypothetical protein [Prevotellaceae bacterium]
MMSILKSVIESRVRKKPVIINSDTLGHLEYEIIKIVSASNEDIYATISLYNNSNQTVSASINPQTANNNCNKTYELSPYKKEDVIINCQEKFSNVEININSF